MPHIFEDPIVIEPSAGGYGEYPARWAITASDERHDTRYAIRPSDISATARLIDFRIGERLFGRDDAVAMTGADHVARQEALVADTWAERWGPSLVNEPGENLPSAPVFQSRRVSLAPLPTTLAQTDKLIADMHAMARRAAKMLGVA